MNSQKPLSAERLYEVLFYDPETGIFTWKKRISGRVIVGKKAGRPQRKGYLAISIDGKRYFCHRLAWLYMYGKWPERCLDHINTNPADNRIANLRDVDDRTNKENQRDANSHNYSTGLLGVSLFKKTGKFTAQIHHNRKKIHLGCFDDPESAHQAYLEAKRKIHAGCMI